jgi:hypothetical protein
LRHFFSITTKEKDMKTAHNPEEHFSFILLAQAVCQVEGKPFDCKPWQCGKGYELSVGGRTARIFYVENPMRRSARKIGLRTVGGAYTFG